MKIGVALSGCDIGGVSARHVLGMLEEMGFVIQMVSSCGIPSVTSLYHGCGFKQVKADMLASRFLDDTRKKNLDTAIASATDPITRLRLEKNNNLAINAVNIADGKAIAFTNAFSLDTKALKTLPLNDAYDALSATINVLDGLKSYRYNGMKLCDFSVWYGCPFYPLRMAGISRIVSIAFLPEKPKTSYEFLSRQGTYSNRGMADVHIPIEFPPGLEKLADYQELASNQIKNHEEELYQKIAFGHT